MNWSRIFPATCASTLESSRTASRRPDRAAPRSDGRGPGARQDRRTLRPGRRRERERVEPCAARSGTRESRSRASASAFPADGADAPVRAPAPRSGRARSTARPPRKRKQGWRRLLRRREWRRGRRIARRDPAGASSRTFRRGRRPRRRSRSGERGLSDRHDAHETARPVGQLAPGDARQIRGVDCAMTPEIFVRVVGPPGLRLVTVQEVRLASDVLERPVEGGLVAVDAGSNDRPSQMFR